MHLNPLDRNLLVRNLLTFGRRYQIQIALQAGCVCIVFLLGSFVGGQEPDHPSLLFSNDDVPRLRKSIESGWMQDAFAVMHDRADEYITTSASPYEMTGAKSTGRILNNVVSTLALTGILTGDQRYCEHAVAIVMSAAKQSGVNDFEKLNGHLAVGDGAHAYSMAYDWLWQYLSPEERQLLKAEIRSFGQWLYDNSITGRGYGVYAPQQLSCNHNSVMHGGLGLCAVVLGENRLWVDRAMKYVNGYLKHSIDNSGYSYEGVSYYGYGSWSAMPFGVAARRAGLPDIFKDARKLPLVPEYYLRQVVPWGSELVSMNDSPDRIGSAGGVMYLISRFQDRVGLWAWLKLHGRDGDGSFGDYPADYRRHRSDGASLPYTLLFADPTLQPLSPADAGMPLQKFFKSGRASFRSGWGDLDAMATFTSGFDLHRGHNHRDENSFTFFARGERFAIDPGYNPNQTRAHNTVLINETGQQRDPDQYDTYGKTKSFREFDSAWLITGEAAEAFPTDANVTKARRQFLFVDAEVPYLVIADDLKTRSRDNQYSWLLHTDPQNTVAIVENKNAAFIKGNRREAICRIDFISPAKGLKISDVDLSNETFDRNGREYRYDRYFKEIRADSKANDGHFITLISAADSVKDLPKFRSKGTAGNMWLEVVTPPNRVDRIHITRGRITIKTKNNR